jgi:tetratricopeptide (TPR) repeat protein
LNANFVLFRALRGDKAGDAIFKRFNVRGTPTVLLIGPDGSEFDCLRGYSPPSERFLERLQKSLQGVDTFKSLKNQYDQGQRTAAVVFKLAEKYSERLDTSRPEERQKLVDLYKEVIALDPDGKTGTTKFLKKDVSYTEYAEFELATLGFFADPGKRDLGPLRAFIARYPAGPMTEYAYSYMGNHFAYSGTKEEAAKFFEEYIAKYPDNAMAIWMYVGRIIRDKEPLDKGIELAEKANEIMRLNPEPRFYRSLAELYILKNEIEKAEGLYGKRSMEGQISSLGYDLIQFAEFWVRQNKHTDDAVAMAETAVRLCPENYNIAQSLAGIYGRLNRPDKALQVYGPEMAKKIWDKLTDLVGYARFWAREGKNLDSALKAAERAVELGPDTSTYEASYAYDGLSQVYLTLKKYDLALQAAEKAVAFAQGPSADYYKKRLEAVKKAKTEEKK